MNISTTELTKQQETKIIEILHSKILTETIMKIATFGDREIIKESDDVKYSIKSLIKS